MGSEKMKQCHGPCGQMKPKSEFYENRSICKDDYNAARNRTRSHKRAAGAEMKGPPREDAGMAVALAAIQVAPVEGEPRVDSEALAEALNLTHQHFRELIEQYSPQLARFGILRVETGEIVGRGQPRKRYLLNEGQATAAATLAQNNERTVAVKMALVEKFLAFRERVRELERQLLTQANERVELMSEKLVAIEERHQRMDERLQRVDDHVLSHWKPKKVQARTRAIHVGTTALKCGRRCMFCDDSERMEIVDIDGKPVEGQFHILRWRSVDQVCVGKTAPCCKRCRDTHHNNNAMKSLHADEFDTYQRKVAELLAKNPNFWKAYTDTPDQNLPLPFDASNFDGPDDIINYGKDRQ